MTSKNKDSGGNSGSEALAVSVRRGFTQLSDKRTSTEIEMPLWRAEDKVAVWRDSEVRTEVQGGERAVRQSPT